MAIIGYSHKFNALKFRILEALYKSKEPMTVRDIEYETGIHCTNISSAMSHYQKIHKRNGKTIKLPYIQRLAKKGPNGLLRYKITKKGIEAYVSYLSRIHDGVTLNRIKYPNHQVNIIKTDVAVPLDQLIPYMKINKSGMKEGFETVEEIVQCVEGQLKHHNSIPESQRRREEAASMA